MAAKFNEVCVVTFVLAMAVLMVLLPRRAGAQECLPPNEAVAKVTAGHPIDQMIMLNAEQTARVSAWWDAYPPLSEDHYDFVIILRDPAHQFAVLIGKDGLVCKATLVPPEVVPSLLNAY